MIFRLSVIHLFYSVQCFNRKNQILIVIGLCKKLGGKPQCREFGLTGIGCGRFEASRSFLMFQTLPAEEIVT